MNKSKTRQEMADEYGVDRKTFYNMLKQSDLSIPSGLITPACQEEIYRYFGSPVSKDLKSSR